jgi:hypothetical protein
MPFLTPPRKVRPMLDTQLLDTGAQTADAPVAPAQRSSSRTRRTPCSGDLAGCRELLFQVEHHLDANEPNLALDGLARLRVGLVGVGRVRALLDLLEGRALLALGQSVDALELLRSAARSSCFVDLDGRPLDRTQVDELVAHARRSAAARRVA